MEAITMKYWISIVVGALLLTGCASAKPVNVSIPPPPSASGSVDPSASSSDYGIGYPPEPNEQNRKAYIETLNDIDPDIVHGKEQTAVDRGRNQCSSIKFFRNDQAKLVALTNDRFTSPQHPDGFGNVKAAKILVAVYKYICPTY